MMIRIVLMRWRCRRRVGSEVRTRRAARRLVDGERLMLLLLLLLMWLLLLLENGMMMALMAGIERIRRRCVWRKGGELRRHLCRVLLLGAH